MLKKTQNFFDRAVVLTMLALALKHAGAKLIGSPDVRHRWLI